MTHPVEPNSRREALIAKLRKLAAMTQANGASEQEALMATDRLAKLMAEYNVAETELTVRADAKGCIHRSYTAIRGKDRWTEACWPMGKLFGLAKVWRSKDEIKLSDDFSLPSIEINFYGFPQDVEAAIQLTRLIHLATVYETEKFLKSMAKGTTRREAKCDDFALGMAHRISARITELIPKPIASTSTGLIILKGQLVNDEFANYCRHHGLRFSHAPAINARDQASYASGQRAGNNIGLGTKAVSGGPLRLSHNS